MGLVSELRRRNVFRMAVLYVVAAWLVMQVTEVVKGLANLPDWIGPTILGLLAIGFPIALIFSWFYEMTAEGVTREKDVCPEESITHVTGRRVDFLVISLLCAAVIMFAYDKWGMSDAPDRSVAVLPFTNISGNPDNEYLSDGLTETLLHALAQLHDLKVPARTSSFFFKGKDVDVREIAEKLGVNSVLEGSIQRNGNKIRVVAQLIEAETGFHIWSEVYDREMSDIFAVQDEIATNVALALNVTLSGGSRKIETVGTDSVAAYEKYLQGIQQKNKGSNTPLLLAKTLFMAALAQDPNFYDAERELAETYLALGLAGELTIADSRSLAQPHVDRLRLKNPDDIFVSILEIRYRNRDRIGIEKFLIELIAAVKKTPNEAILYQVLYGSLNYLQRPSEAFEWLNRGIEVDPLNWRLHYSRAEYLMEAGDLDGAQAAYANAMELNPDNPMPFTRAANIPWQRKQYAEAFALERKAMEADPLDNQMPADLARLLYGFGLLEEADKYLKRANAIAPNRPLARSIGLYRPLLMDDHVHMREMSERILRDDIENRFDSYWIAVRVFVSSMIESGEIEEALAILEEIRPGASRSDFNPSGFKERALHYHAILARAKIQSIEETLSMLDAIVSRWDENFPEWQWRNNPGDVAAIEMARGNTEMAADLALESLGEYSAIHDHYLFYRHLDSYRDLAELPAVSDRLAELDAEVEKGGKEIWEYILEHDLQL